ncbi:hypothetical protein HAX54_029893 [Datura stramonium]|uniref:Uncharacterized protein n=1 Tax=Datura stramonium TaxID=4076 RepID=A0ABS8V816_DATST|nr:hypothetical protein [Datura stramonium]
MRARMRCSIYGLGTHFPGECTSSLLHKEMNISRLMAYAEEMEYLKKRIRADRDKNQHKRARALSTTSVPPARYRNDRRGQNGQG